MKASLTNSPWLDNSGMNKHFQKAFDAMEAAKPASGFCPKKEAECLALPKVQEELGYAIFRGKSGRLLLRMAFSGDRHV